MTLNNIGFQGLGLMAGTEDRQVCLKDTPDWRFRVISIIDLNTRVSGVSVQAPTQD